MSDGIEWHCLIRPDFRGKLSLNGGLVLDDCQMGMEAGAVDI